MKEDKNMYFYIHHYLMGDWKRAELQRRSNVIGSCWSGSPITCSLCVSISTWPVTAVTGQPFSTFQTYAHAKRCRIIASYSHTPAYTDGGVSHARQSLIQEEPGIEPATFWSPHNLIYLMSYCRPPNERWKAHSKCSPINGESLIYHFRWCVTYLLSHHLQPIYWSAS